VPSSTRRATTSRDGHAVAGGVRLHYRESGESDQEPVLVLHGMMGHAREWDVLASSLARAHRVIALDQRGHGESGWATDYTLPAFAADVVALLGHLGISRAHLVGHSMGGLVALAVAADHPALVNRLAVLDVGPDSLATSWGRQTLPVILRTFADASYRDVDQAVAEWMAGNPLVREPLLRHYLEHVLLRRPDGSLVYRFDAARLHQFAANFDPADVWRHVERVSAPTLLVRGEHSPLLSPDTAAAVVRRLPDASFTEIPDAGHDIGVQQPEAVAAAVGAFLAEQGHRSSSG
jgi:esterase